MQEPTLACFKPILSNGTIFYFEVETSLFFKIFKKNAKHELAMN
jgi:hypothetical protein